MTVRIVVLTPVYNEEESIGYMLESLLEQSVKPYYVLIGDNESSDNTVAVAKRVFEKNGFENYRIIRVRRFPDLGKLNINLAYSALNKAMTRLGLSPDYVALIEADVVLEERYFEKLLKYFEKNPKLCIAGGPLEPLGLPRNPFPLRVNMNLWGANRLYRSECWRRLNEYVDIAYLPAWDTDHVVLALLLGYHVTQAPFAKSHTKRGINPFRGKPKGITDALHRLPLWWSLYKALQYRDPEYLKYFILTKLGKAIVTHKYAKELSLIGDVYRYAATRVLISRLSSALQKLKI